jgi:hypothetical protein
MTRDENLGELLIQGLREALAHERGAKSPRSRVRTTTARLAPKEPVAEPIDLTALEAGVLPPEETPDMLNEAVDRWRHGRGG